jgi:hypothetical protein
MRAALPALLLALLVPLAPSAAAGSAAHPEVTDPLYDQKFYAGGLETPVGTCLAAPPAGCIYLPADVGNAWLREDGQNLYVDLQLAQAPPSTFGSVTYRVQFAVAGTAFEALAVAAEAAPVGDGSLAPGGVASDAQMADDTTLELTIPKANLGNDTAGAVVDQLYVAVAASAGPAPVQDVSDRAPDDGFGLPYTLGGPAPGGGNGTAPQGNGTSTTATPGSGTTSGSTTSTSASSATSTQGDASTSQAAEPRGREASLGLIDSVAALLVAGLAWRRAGGAGRGGGKGSGGRSGPP